MGAKLLNGEKKERPLTRVIHGATVLILYRFPNGKIAQRYVTPIPNSNQWHEGDVRVPEAQHTLDVWDHDLGKLIRICLKDVLKWEPHRG